jgi:hypothetical protein
MEPKDSAERVEEGWRYVRNDGRVRPDLLEAAYDEPRLRALFPWTGMGELHFGRCTETRWTWDIPYISPGADGTYWVLGPSRNDAAIGQVATAGEAIAMVVERLPAGCGPAFLGTPAELSAYEAATGEAAD